MNELVKLIKKWISDRKTGNIQINFFKGGISCVKMEETIKIQKQ